MHSVVIAIPARNSAATIRDTLDSALAQTYPNLEIVVVDNGSTDETSAIAREYAERDQRVKLLRHETVVPAESNFNRCLDISRGKLVAILHADDIYEPEMISEQVAFLDRHPECEVVFTHAKIIDKDGKVTSERFRPPELRLSNVVLGHDDLLRLVAKYGNFFTCPSALMKADVFADALSGWKGSEYGSSADLDLWIRASKRARIGFMATPLMRYRVSEHSFSVGLQKVRTTAHPLFKVLDHHLRDLSNDREIQKNLLFLKAKDAALVCLNQMKRNEDIVPRLRLTPHEYLRSLVYSKYHRRFAIRMMLIGFVERLYGFERLRPWIFAAIARVRT